MMHQCYCSEVLTCEASLLRSSLEWILHDWILTNHVQVYWFFCLENLKKYEVQREIVVNGLKCLLLNFLILYLERYNLYIKIIHNFIHLWLVNNLIQLAIIKALSFWTIIFQKTNGTLTLIKMNNFAFNLIATLALTVDRFRSLGLCAQFCFWRSVWGTVTAD